MENTRANEIIIEILQKALTGQLDSSSNISPKVIAEAISTRVVFEKAYEIAEVDNAIGTLIDLIVEFKKTMQDELENLDPCDKLLSNFIRGKITAYEQILEVINNL